jgi:hypothetical protein
MQIQAPKQEIPVLQEWARKIRDILLVSYLFRQDFLQFNLKIWIGIDFRQKNLYSY